MHQRYTNISVQLHVMLVKSSSNEMHKKVWCVEKKTSSCAKCWSLFSFDSFLVHLKVSSQCDLNGQCEINLDNRHICTFCRLKKCFASGMQIELIRCSRHQNTRKSRSNKSLTTNDSNLSYSVRIDSLYLSMMLLGFLVTSIQSIRLE